MADISCDVDFIRDNCVEDTVTVLADSKLRDRKRYPQPCEYSVKFSEPIKLVYGFQILDATIPSTMYNLDRSSNTISYTLFSANVEPVVEPGRRPWLLLNRSFVDSVAAAKDGDSIAVVDAWTVDPNNGDAEHHILANLARLDVFSSVAEVDYETVLEDTGGPQPHQTFFFKLSVPVADAGVLVDKVQCSQCHFHDVHVREIHAGFLPEDRTTLFYDFANGCLVWFVRYFVRSALLSTGFAAALAERDYSSLPPSIVIARVVDVALTAGFYNVDTFLEQFNGVDGREVLASNDANRTMKLTFRRIDADAAMFCMNANRTTAVRILGMDNSPSELLVSDPSTGSVVTPGVTNFVFSEYLVLRCKELEEHVYRDEVAGSAGIGVFKMVDVGSVANLRFDFVSFVRRPFHPISKLSCLTFRFEHSDGSLCDFNGVNNMFIMGIQRYMPKKASGNGYPLNPNYNPDFRTYDIGRMALQRSFEIQRNDDLSAYRPEDFVTEHNHHASRAPRLRLPHEEDFEDCESEYDDDDGEGEGEEDPEFCSPPEEHEDLDFFV